MPLRHNTERYYVRQYFRRPGLHRILLFYSGVVLGSQTHQQMSQVMDTKSQVSTELVVLNWLTLYTVGFSL